MGSPPIVFNSFLTNELMSIVLYTQFVLVVVFKFRLLNQNRLEAIPDQAFKNLESLRVM